LIGLSGLAVNETRSAADVWSLVWPNVISLS